MSAEKLYLDLLKSCLTRTLFPDSRIDPLIQSRAGYRADLRDTGMDWPTEAETMIGMQRLNNVEASVIEVLRNGVPGDLVETGVWRGGACILMRAVLKAYGDYERNVWAVDSFAGLPEPDGILYPADSGAFFHKFNNYLGVSLEQVKSNFSRYGLLDRQVRFIKGWFRDTLPEAPIDKIAVLRLDGDLYESNILPLQHLYWKLSIGGIVIIDDYGLLEPCRRAIEDFRRQHGIIEEVHPIDEWGVYWRRQR